MVLTILGVLSKIQVFALLAFVYFFIYSSSVVLTSSLFSFSANVHLVITDEQEAFIHRVLEIPFEQRNFRDLITLDMLHAYCGGLEPTPAARRLNTYSRWHK